MTTEPSTDAYVACEALFAAHPDAIADEGDSGQVMAITAAGRRLRFVRPRVAGRTIAQCPSCRSFYDTAKYASCPACADWNGQPPPRAGTRRPEPPAFAFPAHPVGTTRPGA